MSMVNARSIRSALEAFFKQHGRDPDFKEFQQLVTGQTVKVNTNEETSEKPEN